MELKDKLVYLRKSNSLTQDLAAKILGIPRSTLASYETGKRIPGIDMLNKMADYYSVSMDVLIGKEEVKEKATDISVTKRKLCEVVSTLPEEKAKNLLDFLS